MLMGWQTCEHISNYVLNQKQKQVSETEPYTAMKACR